MVTSVGYYRDIADELGLKLGRVDIRRGDARQLPLSDASVDGVITSPPYSIALDYVTNDEHALESLGENVRSIRESFIGVRGKGRNRVALYDEDLKKAISEIARVLKPGRYAVIVIGDATYGGEEIPTVAYTVSCAEAVGLELKNNIPKIIFGLYNVMQKENILIFKKAA